MESAKELCPPIRRRTQPWISDECLDMIDEQKCVKLVDFERYCQLSNDVRCRMKEEREAYWLTWKTTNDNIRKGQWHLRTIID